MNDHDAQWAAPAKARGKVVCTRQPLESPARELFQIYREEFEGSRTDSPPVS